ncbi:MAG: ankyrin repeat domain-containing protein [Elusimicrobia bacterium]|nr:ankyrin repeat domain-containing protein [Elusimicrobiota bacterium]
MLFLILCTGRTEDVSKVDELTSAISEKNLSKLRRIIASGVDVNAPNPMMYDLSPFSFAIQKQNIPIIQALLKEGGANPNNQGSLESPLRGAIQTGNLKIVELLVRYGAKASEQGLLHLASAMGQLDIANFLLKRGAIINAKDTGGTTPLHRAVMQQHNKMVSFLINKGSSPDLKDVNGKTPLDYARVLQLQDIISLLTPLTQSPPNDDWHIEFAQAVSVGLIEQVKRFLDYGVDPNSRGWDENYPIHIATLNGHDAIVKLLINGGADIHSRGENGRTPLHHAVQGNRLSLVRLLLERGSDPRLRDSGGKTPLELAYKKREDYLSRDLGLYRDNILSSNDQIIHMLSDQSAPTPNRGPSKD